MAATRLCSWPAWTPMIPLIISHPFVYRSLTCRLAGRLACIVAIASLDSPPMDHSPSRSHPHPQHRRASSMCWCRSRSTRPIPTGCRAAWSWRPAMSSACRSGPREVVGVVWAENANPDPRLHNRLKDVGEKLDVPPLKPELRALRRLGRQLHAVRARHGAAHDLAHGRTSRARADARRRAAGRRAAAAHDAGAAAR